MILLLSACLSAITSYGPEGGVELPPDTDQDGFTVAQGDCDDVNNWVYPGATEVCNGADDNCNGQIDEELTLTVWPDLDGDGSGDALATASVVCTLPEGSVENGDDCDDSSASIVPGATEYCDGVDNDCDAAVDESDAADATNWYDDVDGDGYGDPATEVRACTVPDEGMTSVGDDCDDRDHTVYPDATEFCDNGIDDDCDLAVDTADADCSGPIILPVTVTTSPR